MTSGTGLDVFERIATVHRPDCALMQQPESVPDTAPAESELAAALGNDHTVRYAAACRSVYEDLRRVVGQLAGLMILARLSARADFLDFKEIEICRSRWREAGDKIAALRAPGPQAAHKQTIEAAHTFSGRVLNTFSSLKAHTGNAALFDAMSDDLKQAYKFLSLASSEKAGLVMVDFSHACCSCGR